MTDTIAVTLEIENHYEDDMVPASAETTAPRPDLTDEEGLEEWAFDHLYPLTGTGRCLGDAAYFVRVVESPDLPELVGREFEWGT
jgi:hypothetical protein